MKRLISACSVAALTLQLSACGINANDDDQQAKANRNEQKLKEMYAPVVGQYVGTIQTASGQLGGKLIMYTDSVQDGYDTNGAPLSHTVLKAQLKLDTVGVLDDHTFFVDYKGFDATASFSQKGSGASAAQISRLDQGLTPGATPPTPTAPTSPVATPEGCLVGEHDSSLAINNGLFRGDDFSGTLVKANGTVGQVAMHRGSTATVQPIRDQAERLTAAYTPLVGTYGGRFSASVKPTDPGERPGDFPVRLDILVNYVTVSGVRCPILATQYSRPDIFTSGVGLIFMNTDFNQGDSQVVFRSQDASGPHFATISALWAPPLLQGDMRWYDYFGTFTAKRCATSAVDIDGNCCKSNQTDAGHHCVRP